MNTIFKYDCRIVFFINNYEETYTFYQKIIGAKIYREWNHSGNNGKGVVFELGAMKIEFLESLKTTKPNNSYLYIEVDNVDDYYNNLQNKVKILEDIDSKPWKHRNFTIEDNNGIKLKFYSEIK